MPLDPATSEPLTERLRRPRILAAIVLIGLTGGIVAAFLYARGDLAGADALAYWSAVHVWLGGGDPYEPPTGVMPYAYAPWTLFLFLPWALIPWDLAWLGWRAANIVLFAVSVGLAYRWRPLATAVLLALLGPALAANLDTGNINVLLVVAVWLAYFRGGRLGGLLWGISTGIKWLPAPFLVILEPRARAWGLAVLGFALLLTFATWPQVLHQLDVVVNYPRPVRVDYLIFAWAAVPWLWRQPWPPWWLRPDELRGRWTQRESARAWLGGFLAIPAGSGGTSTRGGRPS